ncbi:MAG: hypothetical protein E7477_08310 [Ruminococcaceae bacterium]|nr:hypothetical protein [Oscillospiraceae bacterium]
MKRIISVFLCFVFTFLFVSCAPSEEIIPEYSSDVSGDIDLGGKVFKMGTVNDALIVFQSSDEGSTLGYINNTEFADLALKRINEVESKYNMVFEVVIVPSAGQTAYHSVMTGDYEFDFIQEESYDIVDYVIAGTFTDLSALSSMDALDEEKWGSRYLLSSMMYDGGLYGVIPAKHPMKTQNSMSSVLAINESYVHSLNETDPRDYYENGEWTWDTFTRVLTDYAHYGQTSNDFVYALASKEDWFTRAVSLSNGDEYLTVNSDGTYEMGFYSDTALKAFDQANEWWNGPTADNIIKGGGVDQLNSNETVIALIDSYQVLSGVSSVAYNLEYFGIVPFPSGPDAPAGWYKSFYESADFVLSIPITAPDAEASALIMDSLFEPLEGYETDEDILEYLTRNYFIDERDAKYFFEIASNDHAIYIDHKHGLTGFFPQILNGTPAQVLESIETQQKTNIEKYILTQYLTMNELYGN